MTNQIRKTNAAQNTNTTNQTSHPVKQNKNVNSNIQSVFNEIEKNNQQAINENDQFMQEMFGDVTSNKKKTQDSTTSQQTPKTKKKVDTKKQKVNKEIEKNHKQSDKEHEQFMKDMFGDVL